jgi:hypothetical protein
MGAVQSAHSFTDQSCLTRHTSGSLVMSRDTIFYQEALNPCRVYEKLPHGAKLIESLFFGIKRLYFSEVSNCSVTATLDRYQIMLEMLELAFVN